MTTENSPLCKMDPIIKAAWIEDLESGESQQYQGGWGPLSDSRRCCLNVLDSVTIPRLQANKKLSRFPPQSAWGAVPSAHHTALIRLNDEGELDQYARAIAYIRENL
jgi:hypothetical protein